MCSAHKDKAIVGAVSGGHRALLRSREEQAERVDRRFASFTFDPTRNALEQRSDVQALFSRTEIVCQANDDGVIEVDRTRLTVTGVLDAIRKRLADHLRWWRRTRRGKVGADEEETASSFGGSIFFAGRKARTQAARAVWAFASPASAEA